ncbi:hypothetical protein DPMN_003428 [Dreissena polymorpha]|uniref:Uncharacterized protein n=1 Tax=Dreissena polymorpha TaxID=45954 RepID=A0A9D4RUQ5_DREPO|nr:hypothetical protein DPMN_003428 [Dreissena polymorpha]
MTTVTSIVYTSDLINILTKFHKDWMKTMISTVYTNKLLTDTHMHAQWTPDITWSQMPKDVLRISEPSEITPFSNPEQTVPWTDSDDFTQQNVTLTESASSTAVNDEIGN